MLLLFTFTYFEQAKLVLYCYLGFVGFMDFFCPTG
jgi:hypothetical protein